MIINIPIFGDFVKKSCVARFSRTFSTLLSSGVDIIECLKIVAGTTGNWNYEKVLLEAKDEVLNGGTISNGLKDCKYLSQMVIHMIDIGERSGNIDLMLSKIADFYETETELMADNFSKIIEPVLLVVLGSIVGFIVITMYLPIFKMAATFG